MNFCKIAVLVFILFVFSTSSFAAPIVTTTWDEWGSTVFPVAAGSNQYSVVAQDTLLDLATGTYRFDFSFTNNDQTSNDYRAMWVGLSNVFIPVPSGAVLQSMSTPSDFRGQDWAMFVGSPLMTNNFDGSPQYGWNAEYPWDTYTVGTTASYFSLILSNVSVGKTRATTFTYWDHGSPTPPNDLYDWVVSPEGISYQAYSFQIDNGPVSLGSSVPTPEPTTLLLLGSGIGLTSLLRRRFIK